MSDSYPTQGQGVKPAAPLRFVKLRLQLSTVPTAYVPLHEAAEVLGVPVDLAAEWCADHRLRGKCIDGHWWITEGDLQRFISRCRWQLIAPPRK